MSRSTEIAPAYRALTDGPPIVASPKHSRSSNPSASADTKSPPPAWKLGGISALRVNVEAIQRSNLSQLVLAALSVAANLDSKWARC